MEKESQKRQHGAISAINVGSPARAIPDMARLPEIPDDLFLKSVKKAQNDQALQKSNAVVRMPPSDLLEFYLNLDAIKQMLRNMRGSVRSERLKGGMDSLLADTLKESLSVARLFKGKSLSVFLSKFSIPSDEDVDPVSMDRLVDMLKYVACCVSLTRKFSIKWPDEFVEKVDETKAILVAIIEKARAKNPSIPQLIERLDCH
ncbi:hypothetical protein [Acetobacter malorum]|uniref:hypothetical protein n=1 Tax=Acetobacter malorum TaxID=178901 RepID=UPI0012E8F1A3|nr:hypothetical protein [Acetobacter malorum]